LREKDRSSQVSKLSFMPSGHALGTYKVEMKK